MVAYYGLTPEVNAFRLTMMGAGPAAHVPAAAGFETASVTHAQGAVQMANTAAATAATYSGLGSAAMMAATVTHSGWMSTAAIAAQRSAKCVESGMGLYGTAVASTIPFGTVVANRVRDATLQSTNILGVNTIPIAETEAEYGEFWGQNASAMTGYLSGVTSLVSALSVPLPLMPGMANPAEALAAGVSASGMSLGLQGASAALSQATQVGATGLSGASSMMGTGLSAATNGASTAAEQATQGSTAPGMLGAPPGSASPSRPGGAPASTEGTGFMQSAQAMMGPMMQAPQALAGAPQMLGQVGQLPSSMFGQASGLVSPMMSGLGGGGFGGGAPGLGAGGLSSAGGWSGLGLANGGYAGGGAPVAASLSKPSGIGVGGSSAMAGPVGVPQKWWNAPGAPDSAATSMAGPRGGVTGTVGGAPMAPGMMGVPPGRSNGQRGHGEIGEADQQVVTEDGAGEGVPVYTDDGGVVYVGGREV